jgi:hypothetical protein
MGIPNPMMECFSNRVYDPKKGEMIDDEVNDCESAID